MALKIYKVTGNSMSPWYSHGDFVFMLTKFFTPFLAPKRDIVFTHPDYGTMIKRIASVSREKQTVTVFGTGPESLSEAQIGPVSFASIKGLKLLNF